MALLLHRCQYHTQALRFLKSFCMQQDVDWQLRTSHVAATEEITGDRIQTPTTTKKADISSTSLNLLC